jgi:hypothetical protein
MASLPFCTAGLRGPQLGFFPSLKRPSPTGSAAAEENSQADRGGSCGLDRRAPGPSLEGAAVFWGTRPPSSSPRSPAAARAAWSPSVAPKSGNASRKKEIRFLKGPA